MEILNRKAEIEKKPLLEGKLQFSINDWGHFAIRYEEETSGKKTKDTLIVFTAEETRKLIRFAKQVGNMIYIGGG